MKQLELQSDKTKQYKWLKTNNESDSMQPFSWVVKDHHVYLQKMGFGNLLNQYASLELWTWFLGIEEEDQESLLRLQVNWKIESSKTDKQRVSWT